MKLEAIQMLERAARYGDRIDNGVTSAEALVLIEEVYRLRGLLRLIHATAGTAGDLPKICHCGMPSCTYKEDSEK